MEAGEDEFRRLFIEECRENLEQIERDLLALESGGEDAGADLVNNLFRAAHSIKGGAAFIGLENIKRLAHRMENVMGLLRDGRVVPETDVINRLLNASDTLSLLFESIDESDEGDISGPLQALSEIAACEVAGSEMAVAVSEAQGADRMPDDSKPSDKATAQAKRPLFEISRDDLRRVEQEGKFLYVVRLDARAEAGGEKEGLAEELAGLSPYGEILEKRFFSQAGRSLPEPVEGPVELVMALFATIFKQQELSLLIPSRRGRIYRLGAECVVRDAGVDMKEIALSSDCGLPHSCQAESLAEERGAADFPGAGSRSREAGQAREAGRVESEDADKRGGKKGDENGGRDRSTLRVKVDLLDSIMDLAGELVLSRNQLRQAQLSKDHEWAEKVGQRIDAVTTELREAVMQTRMQPMGAVFNKFPRLARDLAAELDKEVRLVIEGADVEIDKSLIEAIADPLNHLVRNAVGHGIESQKQRRLAGKNARGEIRLTAFHEAGQVNIEISDDGAGINGDSLAKAAVAAGTLSPERAKSMSDFEKANLAFLPGVSTAKNVTDISGRGVGMDVVKTNMDKLGGRISIFSRPGRGTTVKIQLPLTLAIISSQIVGVQGERFAIPQLNLERLVRIPPQRIKEKIEAVGKTDVLRMDDKLVPLLRLADVLDIARTYFDPADKERKPDERTRISDRRGISWEESGERSPERPGNDEDRNSKAPGQSSGSIWERRSGIERRYRVSSALNIAVVSGGAVTYGIVVDRMLDPEEIVVKPLGRHLKACKCYSGATIMGDGRVALILDVGGLAAMAGLSTMESVKGRPDSASKALDFGADSQLIIVFGGSPDERFAIPLSNVVRIEKVDREKIEIAGGEEILRVQDSPVPVFFIDQAVSANAYENAPVLFVIVLSFASGPVGLFATGPIEIVGIEDCRIDDGAFKGRGVMGSIKVDGKTTVFLDGFEVASALKPEWFSSRDLEQGLRHEHAAILFAEDSKFFRTQVKSYMKSEGFDVIEAEDGQRAWELLQENRERISLVVTDIAMPRLNGYQLTERIKQSDRYSHLPVIALTTLGGDEDIARGKEAGVDDYQIKLDREKLIESIRRHLGAA